MATNNTKSGSNTASINWDEIAWEPVDSSNVNQPTQQPQATPQAQSTPWDNADWQPVEQTNLPDAVLRQQRKLQAQQENAALIAAKELEKQAKLDKKYEQGKNIFDEAKAMIAGAYEGIKGLVQEDLGTNELYGKYGDLLAQSEGDYIADKKNQAKNIMANIDENPQFKGLTEDEIVTKLKRDDLVDNVALSAGVLLPTSAGAQILGSAALSGGAELLKGGDVEDVATETAKGGAFGAGGVALGKVLEPVSEGVQSLIKGREELATLSGTAPVRTTTGQLSGSEVGQTITERAKDVPFIGTTGVLRNQAEQAEEAVRGLGSRLEGDVAQAQQVIGDRPLPSDMRLGTLPAQLRSGSQGLASSIATELDTTIANKFTQDFDTKVRMFDRGLVDTGRKNAAGKPIYRQATNKDVPPSLRDEQVQAFGIPTGNKLSNKIATANQMGNEQLATTLNQVQEGLRNATSTEAYATAMYQLNNLKSSLSSGSREWRLANSALNDVESAIKSKLGSDDTAKAFLSEVKAASTIDNVLSKYNLTEDTGTNLMNMVQTDDGVRTLGGLLTRLPTSEQEIARKAVLSKYFNSSLDNATEGGVVNVGRLTDSLKQNQRVLNLMDNRTKETYKGIISFLDTLPRESVATDSVAQAVQLGRQVIGGGLATGAGLAGGAPTQAALVTGLLSYRALQSKPIQNKLIAFAKAKSTGEKAKLFKSISDAIKKSGLAVETSLQEENQ